MGEVVCRPQPLAPLPSGVGESASPQAGQHLSLRVACAKGTSTSFVAHQYATYPFRLSGNLRLDPTDKERVYAYIMNASPGILAGDDLRMSVEVSDRARLYLTDQSATKVHSQSAAGPAAAVEWNIKVGAGAYLEFVPEPMILFSSAALTQKVDVRLHPEGQMVLSEIVVPGRIARGEFYAFEQFKSRLEVRSPTGTLHFADTLKLLGQSNRFRNHPSLTDYPILGNFIIIAPDLDLDRLSQLINTIGISANALQFGSSPLPNCPGLLVRATATQTSILRQFQHHIVSATRQLLKQASLPKIPK
ncbi:MAG: urease accessory protein UreD [Cyanobacteria bacterium J06581_3]